MNVTRKTFLVQLLGGGWALAGCGGGGDAMVAVPAPQKGTCGATISGNHGHVLAVPTADLSSAVDVTYDIQGSADHSHTVTFTAAMLASLKAGNMVSAVSTTTLSHNHAINESCA